MTGSSDKTIRIWNYETGDLINTLYGNNDEIYSVVSVPNT